MADRHRQHLTNYLASHKTRTAAGSGSTGKPATRASGQSTSQRIDKATTSKSLESASSASARSVKSEDVPVMFTSSTRARPSFLATRRRPPVKITGPAGINNLPDELLLEIFSYLGAGDLLTAARVCKRWQPLANDNFLWEDIFERYGSLGAVGCGSEDERKSLSYYKSICIKKCSDKRNKKAIRFLKKISPFTGLPRDTDKALRAAGVYFHLCLIDRYDKEHVLTSRDVFYHQMAACVRWYDLEMLSIKSIKEVQVYSINPLFFEKNGSALSNSPYQRSLLLIMEFDWTKWMRTNKPTGSDDMVNLYSLTDGVTVATWKNDGELAFLCQGLHSNQLVQRCLYGTSTESYDIGTHKVLEDDIDSSYGLHGYQCTVEIRTLRNSIWSQQFNYLSCKKETVGSGFATFPLIRQDYHCDHVILQKKLNFPWKTDAFKGIVEDVVWVDLTVLDERNEPFWCISTCARVGGQSRANNFDFDYSSEDTYTMTYMDKTGKLEASMSKTDEKDYFMSHMDLKLSLDAINSWFGTSYK